MKRLFLFTAMGVVMMLSANKANAYDFSAVYNGQTIYYDITSSTAPLTVAVTYETTSFNSYSGNVDIPDNVTDNGNTYSVTSIGGYAFSACSGLTAVTIPNSVTTIGVEAFRNCSGLVSVNFNATNCTTMGNSSNRVFSGCSSFTTLTIGNNVQRIPDYAFSLCSKLTSITIPNSVRYIGNYAFQTCYGLTSVIIPDSITSIGNYAFYDCSGLTSVNFNAINCTSMGNQSYPVFSNCSSFTTLTIGNNVQKIPDYAFCNARSLTSVMIGNSVTTIGNRVFEGCIGLTNINVSTGNPNYSSVNGVLFNKLQDTLLQYPVGRAGNYTIPNTAITIGEMAFLGCNSLISVTIPNSVTSIEGGAFAGCNSLISVIISNSVTSIGYSAFADCSGLTSITIPNSVTSIGDYAFYNCSSLTSITIPNSVTSIGEWAFYYCYNLTSITIGNSVISIGASAFSYCSGLTAVTIPNSVTTIGGHAFYYCRGLTSVTIPDSVTSIEEWTFSGCNGLTSVTIGNSVTSIGNYAFMHCTSLATLNFNAKNCDNFSSNTYYHPFDNCTSLSTVNIGDSVTTIPDYFMYASSSLSGTLTIPNSITSIGDYAFYNCSSLTALNFNATNCNSMSSSVFSGCTSLNSLTIGNNVETIPASAFYNCNGLTSVTIPSSVTFIGSSAFAGCSGLTSITSYAVVPPALDFSAFYAVSANTPVYVPCFSINDYRNSTDWSNYFSNYIVDGPATPDTTYYTATICLNSSYSDDNFTAPLTQAGTYYITLSNAQVCDSVVAVMVGFYSLDTTSYSATTCYGTSYSDQNFTNLTQAGMYKDTLQNIHGCDSIVTLFLNIDPPIYTYYSETICKGTSYSDQHFRNLTQMGLYNDTLLSVKGCDSIVRLTLNYYDTTLVLETFIYDTVCYGQTYTLNGFTENVTGTYTQILPNINGCDSVVTLYLYIRDSVLETFIYDTVCYGYTYTLNGFTENTTGIYTHILSNIHGCDSVVTLNLYIRDSVPETIFNAIICYGDVYIYNGFSENQTGTYTQILSNIYGCDSIVILNLEVIAPPSQQEICMISVDNDFHNEITWKYEEEVISYNIYREGVQSNQYDLLVNIPYESNNMWIDTSSNAASRSYQYKISAIDSCGNESPLSESHKTMHLTISQGVGNAWNLIWTPYEGATYQTYNIYRTSGDTTGIFELITTISSNNTSYTDNYTPNGYVYYMVEIVLDNPCSLKKALSSIRSNIATNKSTTQTAISETQTSLISVYPNPAMDNITVTLPENVPQAVFTLYDMQGKELIRQEVSNQDKVKVNGFAAGIYVYKVVTAKESYQGKIIIKD